MSVESPAGVVWRISQATQASASCRMGQPFAPRSYSIPLSLSGWYTADLPNFPASSRLPESNTLTVNARLRRIIGNDLDVFSTETAINGGSNDTCVSQLAVNTLTSPWLAHETA